MSEKISAEVITEKSFDVLSSVRLYRYDLAEVGEIRPETRQRVFDEEFSYIAEGIDRHNYTEFILHTQNGELVYFHEGRWRPYISTLITGLRTAQAEATADPRKQFEADRRSDDLLRGYQLQKLSPGEKLHWYYEFPREQLALYGEKFISDMGFYPARAMGYLCEAEKTIDGRLVLRHQSVDNSDRDAFDSAMSAAAAGDSIDGMMLAYDRTLQQKRGHEYYAGRPANGEVLLDNAWSSILRHNDLLDYMMDQVEAIARGNLSEEESERAKKKLTYGVWARLKERLDQQSIRANLYEYSYSGDGSIQSQVESAYQSAAARGEALFGCGGTIRGEAAILSAAAKDIFSMTFGSEKKWFSCYYCGAKQYGDPCASHLYCPTCTAEVKDGKVLSTGRNRRTVRKGFFEILHDEFGEWNRRYNMAQAEKKAKQAKAGDYKV